MTIKSAVFSPLAFLLLLLWAALPANAHFSTGVQKRTIIVTQNDATAEVYIEAPLPLFYSDIAPALGADQDSGDIDALYLKLNAKGQSIYWLSLQHIADNRAAFTHRLATALQWSQNGQPVDARVRKFRIIGRDPIKPFNSPDTAARRLNSEGIGEDPDFGIAFVQMQLSIAAPKGGGALSVQSRLPALTLNEDVSIENRIIDMRGDQALSYAIPGQLQEPLVLDRSTADVMLEYIYQGMLHILEGADHVLLVIAMTLGALNWQRLVLYITAFTLGHSVTLITSFLGYAPDYPWFIPLVEFAIAASVLYAAGAALLRRSSSVLVFAVIGLLHGLGFSFVLGEILGRESPDLLLALLTFNIGIEMGQLILVAITLILSWALMQAGDMPQRLARLATLAVISVISIYWMIERVGLIWA